MGKRYPGSIQIADSGFTERSTSAPIMPGTYWDSRHRNTERFTRVYGCNTNFSTWSHLLLRNSLI